MNDMEMQEKRRILDEIFQYDEEYVRNTLTPIALKKMQDFLVQKGHAQCFRDIKKLPRIEIKGRDINGGERRIGKEIRENYGISIDEANEKLNVFFPIFQEGVIKYESREGNHYTHFKVLEQTEKTFELEIKEYKYYHDTFYLTFQINIKELSKCMPYYSSYCIGKDVRTIFYDPKIVFEVDSQFTGVEKLLIQHAIRSEQNEYEEFDIILNNTLSHFLAVNFIWDVYRKYSDVKEEKNIDNFYDNVYFSIKNWTCDDVKDWNDIYHSEINQYVKDIIHSKEEIVLLKRNTIEKVINGIAKSENMLNFYAAIGFVYKSGLSLIEKMIDDIAKQSGECDIIIGSLQNYDKDEVDKKIDKSTVIYLNNLIQSKKVAIYTYKPSFYHGKFYCLQCETKSYIIVGSSNISKQAFQTNYEMDVLYSIEMGSEREKIFLEWYNELKDQCDRITRLDDKKFDVIKWNSELDAYEPLKKQKVSEEEIKRRICELTDEETKFRMNLWMEHNPDYYYDNVLIDALESYTMFVFAEEEFVVFESFTPQNRFYRFGCPNGLDDLISNISNMSKSQMTFSEYYISRGNHVTNKDNLRKRINDFFKKNN